MVMDAEQSEIKTPSEAALARPLSHEECLLCVLISSPNPPFTPFIRAGPSTVYCLGNTHTKTTTKYVICVYS